MFGGTIAQLLITKEYSNYIAYIFNNCAHSTIFILLNYIIYTLSARLNYILLKKSTYVMMILGLLVFAANIFGISHNLIFFCVILVLFIVYNYKHKIT